MGREDAAMFFRRGFFFACLREGTLGQKGRQTAVGEEGVARKYKAARQRSYGCNDREPDRDER